MTEWKDLFKIKFANPEKSMLKHEVAKLVIVLRLLEKYKRQRRWIRIYTEFNVLDNKKCDIYFENLKTKEVYIYEIQKRISKDWLKQTKEAYKDYHPIFMKTVDLIIVDLKKLPDDINKIYEEVEEYIL